MYDFWALTAQAARKITDMMRSTDISAISSEQLDIPDPEFRVENKTALIPVKGFLSKQGPGIFERLFLGGGTSYEGIIKRMALADNDADVDLIKFQVESPGGNVAGVYDVVDAMKKTKKPIIAEIDNMAASAAYLIASHADKIIALHPADIVGSVGVRVTHFVSNNIIDITSTDAPLKAPDVKTQEGIDAVRTELDMLHHHLVTSIAEGRGIDVETVNKDFGRGGILTADIAIERGMIDSIGVEDTPSSSEIKPAPQTKVQQHVDINIKTKKSGVIKSKSQGGKKYMNLATFFSDAENADGKLEHDNIVKAAVAQATTDERSRVVAHLENIEHSSEVVVTAIKEGKEFDNATMSTYMNASIKAAHGAARAGDNPAKVTPPDGGGDLGGGGEAMTAAVDKHLEDLAGDDKSGIIV